MAMQAGLRYVLLSPAIRTVLVRGFFFGLLGSALWALDAGDRARSARRSALTYGILFGAFGVGAVIGALFATTLRQRLSNESIVALSTLVFGVMTVGIAFSDACGDHHDAAARVRRGVGAGALHIQHHRADLLASLGGRARSGDLSDAHLRGPGARQLAVRRDCAAITASTWRCVIAGVAMTLSAALGLKLRLPRTLGLNLDPFRKTPMPPNMTAEVVPQSGPVVITVEYHIAPEDRDAFMMEMREMRRIRRRDGARRWILLQDIDDPSRWTERFQSATWLDYLRQRQRFTMADREAALRVHAFHRGRRCCPRCGT